MLSIHSRPAWNKGLTKKIDNRLNGGCKKGNVPWNKDKILTKEEMKHWKKREYPPYLRKCRLCQKEANSYEELESFVKQPKQRFGHLNLCKNCYKFYRKIHGKQNLETVRKNAKIRYQQNPKKYIERGKCAILYRRARIPLNFNPRKGICKLCGKSIEKGEITITHLHHMIYEFTTDKVRKNHQLALKNTIEICFSCHTALHAIQEAIKPENQQLLIKLLNLAPKEIKERAINFIRFIYNIDLESIEKATKCMNI